MYNMLTGADQTNGEENMWETVSCYSAKTKIRGQLWQQVHIRTHHCCQIAENSATFEQNSGKIMLSENVLNPFLTQRKYEEEDRDT